MRSVCSIVILAALCAGCAASQKAPRPKPQASAATKAEPEPAVLVDRTLIYPVRYGRAEDLAITLEPLLLQMYGPGVRIVPQVQSNRLLILIPPRQEREAARRSPENPGPPRPRT